MYSILMKCHTRRLYATTNKHTVCFKALYLLFLNTVGIICTQTQEISKISFPLSLSSSIPTCSGCVNLSKL